MDYLHIALIALAVAGVWAVAELALTIRSARRQIGDVVQNANETIEQVQPIVDKLDGIVDELDPTIKQVPDLLEKVGTTVESVNGILGDVSTVSGTASGVTASVSKAANNAATGVSNVFHKIAGRAKGKTEKPAAIEQPAPAPAPEQPAEPAEDVSRPGYVDYGSATASDGE